MVDHLAHFRPDLFDNSGAFGMQRDLHFHRFEHHQHITNLHLKDRKKHQGDNVPWGTGDTPIREVLQLLKRERWPIRAFIEYEHKGAGTPVAVTVAYHAPVVVPLVEWLFPSSVDLSGETTMRQETG